MSAYRVTVTKESKVLFSTDTESTATMEKALKVYQELAVKFTALQGYSVMIFEINSQVLFVDPWLAKHRR